MNEVLWHSPEGNFTGNAPALYLSLILFSTFDIDMFMIITASSRVVEVEGIFWWNSSSGVEFCRKKAVWIRDEPLHNILISGLLFAEIAEWSFQQWGYSGLNLTLIIMILSESIPILNVYFMQIVSLFVRACNCCSSYWILDMTSNCFLGVRCSVGAHFRNHFSIVIHVRWKIDSALIQVVDKRSL